MNVEREPGGGIVVRLAGSEVTLLRRALEKASFIDIPRDEQPAVAVFCTRALEMLGEA